MFSRRLQQISQVPGNNKKNLEISVLLRYGIYRLKKSQIICSSKNNQIKTNSKITQGPHNFNQNEDLSLKLLYIYP